MRNQAARTKAKQQNKPWLNIRFGKRFNPPIGSVKPALIRLIPGNYVGYDKASVPYFEYADHFNATVKKGHVCSRIWKRDTDGELYSEGKCVSCYMIEDGSKNTSVRHAKAFSIVHYDWYYEIPKFEKNGRTVKYTRNTKDHKAGDVIYHLVNKATAIKDIGRANLKKYDKVFGQILHWSLGPMHYDQVTAALSEVERECTCGGRIEIPVYECPECGYEALDLTDESSEELSNEEIYNIVTEFYDCPKCKNVVELMPVKFCDKCDKAESVQIWDVDFEVYKTGEATQSQIHISRYYVQEPDERVLPLLDKHEDNLHRAFCGDPIDYQLKMLKVKDPWAGERRDTADYVRDEDETVEYDDDDIEY